MSLAALMLLLSYVAIFGIQGQQGDESLAARIFQILLAGQVPIVAFFIVKWLPQMPKQTLKILVLQIIAALIPIALVVSLEVQ